MASRLLCLWGCPMHGNNADVLITGAAGFIGSHLAEHFVGKGNTVVGVDCFTDYYRRSIKERNISSLMASNKFVLRPLDLACNDLSDLNDLFPAPPIVFHLAAEPGVRNASISDLGDYLKNNVLATARLLSWCADLVPLKVVYVSTSAVYGDSRLLPATEDNPARPISVYGATKLTCENLCHVYWREHGIPVSIVRLFTVFGPRQRPDMAFCRFLSAVARGLDIDLRGEGDQTRDFTYVTDAVNGIARSVNCPDGEIVNIGSGNSYSLKDAIRVIERVAGKEARVRVCRRHRCDMMHTLADISKAKVVIGYEPQIDLVEGLTKQMVWMLQNTHRIAWTDRS